MRHSDGGDCQYLPKMEGQSRPARVIAPGGVDDQHRRRFGQGSRSRLEKGALPNRKVTTPIGPTRSSGHS